MNKTLPLLSTIVLALLPISSQGAAPNIVIIVVDDLGYADLSCTGIAKDVKTPNIDKLAQRGVRFTNAYATAPICNASRVSIMTGCYQQRQGQYWYGGEGLLYPKFVTIAEVLKSNGYTTGYVGKFHHGTNDKLDKRGFPLNHGFDHFYGFSGGTKHYLHHGKKYGKTMLHEGPMWIQREQKDVEGFTTELFGKEARTFIQTHKDKPFYLQVSFNAVHNFTHQLPPKYLKEKGLKGVADLQPDQDYWQWRKKISYPSQPEGRAYYVGQLHFLDFEIGRLMKELEEQGIAENTAILFVSDNGGSLVTYANNGILKGGKYTLFEGGTRIPLIISHPPKFRTKTISQSVVSTMDLFPTICSLCDISIPPDLDGMDLSPLLEGELQSIDPRTLFWDTQSEQSVRKGKWKLLVTKKSPNPRLQITNTPKGIFLYDIESDPGEDKNLLSIYPEVAEKMQRALNRWQSDVVNSQKNAQKKQHINKDT